jgi:hypothetical protein
LGGYLANQQKGKTLTTEKIACFFGMNLSAFLQFVTVGPTCDEPANNPLHLTGGDCAPEINLNNNPASKGTTT